MKIGITSYAFPWSLQQPRFRSHLERCRWLLDEAGRLGVGVVQLADNVHLSEIEPAGLRQLVDQARESDLELEVGIRGLEPAQLYEALRNARTLQAGLIRTVPDLWPDQGVRWVERLRALAPVLQTAGVVLAIENHGRVPARQLGDLIQAVNSPSIGVCLDTVNSLENGEDLYSVVEALRPWVVNLHLKDVRIFRPAHQLGLIAEGCPLGKGIVDLKWLWRHLPGAVASHALVETWTPPQSTPEETCAMEQVWVEESLRVVKDSQKAWVSWTEGPERNELRESDTASGDCRGWGKNGAARC